MHKLRDALSIARFKWPDKQAVFVFDNSSCHDSFADDAQDPAR